MSNQLAISAITAGLAQVIQNGLVDQVDHATVTTLPPGSAVDDGINRINLFLYRISIDPALANSDWPPTRVHPGEPGRPPLSLGLHYLLTPFGIGIVPTQPADDMLLGYAMAALHDHPILEFSDILAAAVQRRVLPDAGAELPWQSEGVRVTFEPLTLDELTKLWTTFQAGYRVSAGYQASVVLIDSRPPARVRGPVLRRGPADRGPVVSSGLSLLPTLETVWLRSDPNDPATDELLTSFDRYAVTRPVAVPGSTLVIRGRQLDAVAYVELAAARTGTGPPAGFEPGAAVGAMRRTLISSEEMIVVVPPDLPAAGRYLLTARLDAAHPDDPTVRPLPPTNRLPLIVGPSATHQSREISLADTTSLVVEVKPPVITGQDPGLYLGSRRLEPTATALPAARLEFSVAGIPVGSYSARLRVDGVDSEIQTVTLR